MGSKTRVTIALAFFCAMTAAVGLAQNQPRSRTLPPAPAVSDGNTQRASCVLQLDFDANRGSRMDASALNALLTSTALIDPAAQAALGLSAEEWPKVAQVELQAAGTYAVKLTVTLSATTGNAVKPGAAKAFMREIANRAKAAIEQGNSQDKAGKDRLDQLDKDLATAKAKQSAAEAAVRQARQEVGGIDYGGRSSVGMSTIERQAMELSLIGQRARLKSLEASLVQGRGAADPKARQTSDELVQLRQEALDLATREQAAGQLKASDVMEAKAKLMEARLAAEDRARQIAASDVEKGFGRMDTDIISLRAAIAEGEAKLAYLSERAAKASTAPSVDLAALSSEEQRARQDVNDLQMQVDNLRRMQRNGGGIRLVVLDGLDTQPKQ